MAELKTLVVDDEPVSRRLMQIILNTFGTCAAVGSGKEAIGVFRESIETGDFFDLVTLDVSMPGIDGTKVLMIIRELERESGLDRERPAKVLMVTAHSDQRIVKTSIMAGCDGYIVKPYTKDIIVDKLKQLGLAG